MEPFQKDICQYRHKHINIVINDIGKKGEYMRNDGVVL